MTCYCTRLHCPNAIAGRLRQPSAAEIGKRVGSRCLEHLQREVQPKRAISDLAPVPSATRRTAERARARSLSLGSFAAVVAGPLPDRTAPSGRRWHTGLPARQEAESQGVPPAVAQARKFDQRDARLGILPDANAGLDQGRCRTSVVGDEIYLQRMGCN